MGHRFAGQLAAVAKGQSERRSTPRGRAGICGCRSAFPASRRSLGLAAGKGNYAVIPGCKGELGQALALVEKAKALWKNLGDKSNWERLLINKGRVLAKLGQPGRTTACLRRAGKLLRRGREWPALAVSLTTVASFYSKQGKNRLAGKAFDRARSRAGRIREARFAWPAFMAIKRPGCWESDCWPRLRLLPKRPSCPASAAG